MGCTWRAGLHALGVVCFSRGALRNARVRFQLKGMVETHHVIPRCCRGHPTLQELRFSTEDDANFALMPTKTGAATLHLRNDRLVHAGGHMAYNGYVWGRLDGCSTERELVELLEHLHRAMRRKDPRVPWNGACEEAATEAANDDC